MASPLRRALVRGSTSGVLLLGAALALTPSADARSLASRVLKDQAPLSTSPTLGGGQFLMNTPGGYYMGHMWVGDTFTMNTMSYNGQSGWTYTGGNGSSYLFIKAPRGNGKCFWGGPSESVNNMTGWASFSGTSSATDVCSATQLTRLQNRDTFSQRVNCAPGTGNGPAQTLAVASAAVYANLNWSYDSSTGTFSAATTAGRDQITTISAGQQVNYRYTTTDGNWLAIAVPGIGWGFAAAGSVNRFGDGGSPKTYNWSAPNPAHPPAVRGYAANAGWTPSQGTAAITTCPAGF